MAEQQRTVLIVDPDEQARYSVRQLLHQDASVDYQLLEAENWEQALDYLHQQQPDCLLLYDQLPDTNWGTLLQTLTEPTSLRYPIVMLTDDNHPPMQGQPNGHGVHGVLSKGNLTALQVQWAVNSAIEQVLLLRHLEAEREWSRLILGAVRDGVITTDLTGCVTYMNSTAEQLTGWSATAAHGQPLAQIFFPIDETTGQPIPDPLAEALYIHQDSSQAQPTRLTGPQGRTVPIAYQSNPIQDRLGTRSGIVLTFQDLSERKAAEETLHRREEMLRQIIDHVPGLCAYVGADGRYHFVNATSAQWFQRPRHQIIGTQVREMLGDQSYERVRPYRQQALAGETVTYETTLQFPDGINRTVWVQNQPDFADDGTVLGVYLYIRDISERKQAEADMHFLEDLAETIRMATDADALLWAVCQAVGDYLALGRCHFIEVDQANDRMIIHRDYCRGVPSVAGELSLSTFDQLTWGELAAGRVLVNHDSRQDPRTAARYGAVYEPLGWGAYVAVPLLREEKWCGVLAVTTLDARQWQPREIQLLETVAERSWLAVEKLRLEAAVRASEEQLRQIADHVPGLITMVNEREEYEFANHYLKEWLGLEPAQIIGRTLADVLGNQAFYQELQPLVKQVLAGETVIQERLFTLVSGATLHILITLVPRRAADGRVTGWYNLTTDITGRKQAEADARFLADLAETIRLAEDEATFWAQVTQRIGDYLRVARCHFAEVDEANDRAQIHHDYCRGVPSVAGELSLSTFDQLTWGELAAGRVLVNHDSRQDPRTAARYGAVYEPLGWGAYVAVPLLREEKWCSVLAVTTLDARQWQPREIGLLETVAERSWLAVEKLRLDAAVRASEEQLRQITDHLPGIISVLNAREEYEFVSRRHEEWLGRSRQEMLGHTLAEMIGEHAYATARPYLHRALAGETVSFENRLNTINDGVMDVQVTFVPRRANGDPVTGCYGLVVDITARKQMEHMLQRFNEQLERQAQEREIELTKRLGELDQFAYVTSHDLKAPLRAIEHLARWISEDAAELLPPESRGHLEKMMGRITRMEKLLDDLLAYSRADRYEYKLERVDLSRLIEDIVQSVAPPPGFTIDLHTSQPVLVTQKVLLDIVLRNLISNAIKHHITPNGQIEVAVEDRPDFLEVNVQDDGPGIAPEFHERIFHMFQTLKPRDQVEGSGMGLAIVKKIVESRGGRIVVESALDFGSKFTIMLPK